MIKIVSIDTTVTEHCTTAKMVVRMVHNEGVSTHTFTGWSKVHPKDVRHGQFDPAEGTAIAVGRMFHEASMFYLYQMARNVGFPDQYTSMDVGLTPDGYDVLAMAELAEYDSSLPDWERALATSPWDEIKKTKLGSTNNGDNLASPTPGTKRL